SGDAEGEIVLCRRCRKVGLGNLAAAGVDAAGDREESVNAAVPNGVRGWIRKLETGFADRTVQGDKRRHGVGGALQRRDRNLRIDGRARASNCRLRMTSGTTVQIKSWAESGLRPSDRAGDRIDFLEYGLRILEDFVLLTAQTVNRSAGACCAGAHARVSLSHRGG